ncbi:3538_t:CDS:2 [Entrophospora sp. SA101]|nr:3538_t:CDS:2 [Entrophospora sp. SA101]
MGKELSNDAFLKCRREDTKVVVTKEKAAEEEEEVMNKLESGIVVVENVSFKASQTRDRAYS